MTTKKSGEIATPNFEINLYNFSLEEQGDFHYTSPLEEQEGGGGVFDSSKTHPTFPYALREGQTGRSSLSLSFPCLTRKSDEILNRATLVQNGVVYQQRRYIAIWCGERVIAIMYAKGEILYPDCILIKKSIAFQKNLK